MKSIITFMLLTISYLPLLAQSRPAVLLLGIQYGAFNMLSNRLSPADWDKMAPDVPNPQGSDFFYHSEGGRLYETGFFEISGLAPLGMKPVSHGNLQPLAGISIGTIAGSRATGEWQRNTRTPYDVLTGQTGQQYYLDSVSMERVTKEYSSSNLLIGLKFLLQTDTKERWVMTFGVAAKYGFSYNSRVTTTSGTTSYIEQSQGPEYLSWSRVDNYTSISRSGPKSTQLWISVPVEISYRLGKTKPLWQRASIGVEASVGSRTSMIAGYGSVTSLTYSAVIGVRYSILNFSKPLVTHF